MDSRAHRRDQNRQREEAAIRAMWWLLIGVGIGILIMALAQTAGAEDASDEMDLNTFIAVQKLSPCQKLTYFAVLAVLDYQQTVAIGRSTRYYELNPVLGPHPGRAAALAYFGTSILAAWTFVRKFPESRLKPVIMDSVLATQQVNVRENRDLDIHGGRRKGLPVMLVASFTF